MHVFLDDFTMYDACDEHLHQLHFFLERCHSARLSLNPAKCAFEVTSSLNQFRHYLLSWKFVFHVDHATLLYLVLKQSRIGKVALWMLLLHEFEFKIQHRPRMQH